MKLAKYWTRSEGEATDHKGRIIRAVARGWSNESMEVARAVARDIAQRLAQGNFPTRGPQYLWRPAAAGTCASRVSREWRWTTRDRDAQRLWSGGPEHTPSDVCRHRQALSATRPDSVDP